MSHVGSKRDVTAVGAPILSSNRRSRRSHRAVLDAAAKLLSERGYAGITIEGIAAEAGVGKMTIYRWWSTKASIYMELYAELAAQIAPPADTGDVVTDLRQLVRGSFRLYRNTAAGLALAGIIAEAQSNPEVSRIVRNEFVPSRRQITKDILERAAARGEIARDVDLDLVSDVITGAVWHYILAGIGPFPDRHADRLVLTILRGVVPIDGNRAKPLPEKSRPRSRADKGV